MEKLNFGCSLKNMPKSDEKSYKLHLLEKIEVFIKKTSFITSNKKATEDEKVK